MRFRSTLSAILVLHILTVHASQETRRDYLQLIQQYPSLVTPKGVASKGEIEIVTDEAKMAAIEEKIGRDVGLIKIDRYWLWINDACIFPSGAEGIYGRILWVRALEGLAGVAVMPLLDNERVVLNCNYRHATRAWEMELPRGIIDPGETAENAARREVLEETGFDISSLELLGSIPPDSGLTANIVPIYVAQTNQQHQPEREDSEAIEGIIALSFPEIRQALVAGYLMYPIRGQLEKVHFRDPFLAYAVLLYDLKSANCLCPSKSLE